MSKINLTDMLAEADEKYAKGVEAKTTEASPATSASIPVVDAATKTDNSTLKTQRFREIEPSRCRPWKLHNRDSVWLTPESCSDLIESIKREGQLDLGLVRPLTDDPGHDYEIIYGARRWYSVSQIPGAMFKARVTDADDRECTQLMHVENENSKDISALEKGRSYRKMLSGNIYASVAELATEFNLSRTYVHYVVKAVEILDFPKLNALLGPHIREISYKDAKTLAAALEDHKCLERVEVAAIDLGQGGSKEPKQIMLKLLAAAMGGAKTQRKPKPVVSLYKKGKKKYAYTSEKPNGSVTVTIEPGLKEAAGDDIEAVLERIVSSLRKTIGLD